MFIFRAYFPSATAQYRFLKDWGLRMEGFGKDVLVSTANFQFEYTNRPQE